MIFQEKLCGSYSHSSMGIACVDMFEKLPADMHARDIPVVIFNPKGELDIVVNDFNFLSAVYC